MRSLLVLGWVFACAAFVPAQEKQTNPILTKDGNLTQELVVHETEGGGLASKSRRWTVKPNGEWELAVRDVGVVETKGKLSKEQLKALADDLVKYQMNTLPNRIPRKVPRGAKTYEVRYGSRQVTTTCVLPKPNGGTIEGRYAGIIDTLERHLKKAE